MSDVNVMNWMKKFWSDENVDSVNKVDQLKQQRRRVFLYKRKKFVIGNHPQHKGMKNVKMPFFLVVLGIILALCLLFFLLPFVSTYNWTNRKPLEIIFRYFFSRVRSTEISSNLSWLEYFHDGSTDETFIGPITLWIIFSYFESTGTFRYVCITYWCVWANE